MSIVSEKETRNTLQRDLVKQSVTLLKNHPDAEAVYSLIQQKHMRISKATVYSNLKVLAEQGAIMKIDMPNQSTRYDHNTHKHYHMLCRQCKKLFDCDLPFNEGLIEAFKKQKGFVVEGYDLILNGVCPECIKKLTEVENG